MQEICIPKGSIHKEYIECILNADKEEVTIVAQKASKGFVFLQVSPKGDESECTIKVQVQEHAELTLLVLQIASSAHVRIIHTSSVQAEGHLHVQNVTLGGDVVDQVLLSELQGVNAISSVDWVFYAKNSQKHSISATNIFLAPNGGGEITLKGVAEQQASVYCNGMINIGLNGGGTDAYLTEDVLMLDKTAKVDAIPGLEIKTNDVKASHSATISQVSPEELFYFLARGIAEKEARRMYIEGFLGDLVRRISSTELQQKISQNIADKYAEV